MSPYPTRRWSPTDYHTSADLDARSQITRYNLDPYPWQRRAFDHLALPAECRVLRPGGRFFAATNGKGGDELAALLRRVDPALAAAEAATIEPTRRAACAGTYELRPGVRLAVTPTAEGVSVRLRKRYHSNAG